MSRGQRVKLAEDPVEIRDLLAVRQRVKGVGVDVFDALTTSEHLVGLDAGVVQGGLRLTVDSAVGLPCDALHDFRPMLPAYGRLGEVGRVSMEPDGDRTERLLQGLVSMAGYRAYRRGLTHLVALALPDYRAARERVGFVPVAAPVDTPEGPRLPMVLDLHAMSWEFADFVRRQDVGLWLDTFERAFFDAGEPIVVVDEPGDEAYLVVDGRADAVASDDRSRVLATFAHGDMFGELAMLTDRPRATTVVAAVPTDLMVLRRERFRRQAADNPDLAEGIMRSIGDRFQRLLRQTR